MNHYHTMADIRIYQQDMLIHHERFQHQGQRFFKEPGYSSKIQELKYDLLGCRYCIGQQDLSMVSCMFLVNLSA